MTREWRWQVLKVAVSIVLLGFLLSRVDLGQISALLREAHPGFLALAFGTTVVAWLLNTLKWQRLLHALGQRLPYRQLLMLNYIGIFYALVLPGQVSGEVMKGIRLTRAGISVANTVVSIGVDRLTGLIALGILGFVGLLVAPSVAVSQTMLWFSAAAAVLAGGPLLFVALRSPAQVNLLPRIGALAPLQSAAFAAWQGLAAYQKSPSLLIAALLQAVGFQVLVTLSNYLAALGVGVELPAAALLWIVATVSLVHMVPISFAGLGIREGAYVFLLNQYGVPLTSAVALSITVSGMILLQGVIGGILDALSLKSQMLAARSIE